MAIESEIVKQEHAGRQNQKVHIPENLHPLVLQLLQQRGITTEEERREFLSPMPKKTYDPFLLKNMKEGVERIFAAVDAGEKICIYGDYDTDGVTSVSIMMTVLKQLTDNLMYYIPSRFEEGYGLNKNAVQLLREKEVDLIVTVDCGSVSVEEVDTAKSLGMDVVVTDHHSVEDRFAKCILINPRQKDCPYPFKGLAGCGVAYKVAQAMERRGRIPRSLLARLLDLVAIGTIGDVVPLIDENRTLVKYGLRELNSGKRLSLKLFNEIVALEPGSIGSQQVAFTIVPRINAAGRMDKADTSVSMLLSEESNTIRLHSLILQGYNDKRKEIQEKTYQMCMTLLEEQCKNSLFPVIFAEEAHEGITGIVAGKIRERINKPVIIVTPNNGMLKGTGRSTDNIDLYKVMKTQENLFVKFGGHKGACGFTMEKANLDKLRKGLHQQLAAMDSSVMTNSIAFDLDIEPTAVTVDLIKQLTILEPFGSGNSSPLFRLQKVTVDNVRYMGNHGQHVRIGIFKGNSPVISAVLFGTAADYQEILEKGNTLDIIGSLSVNRFNGKESPQIEIRHMKES